MLKRIIRKINRIVTRYFNQKHCYDYLSQNDGWEKIKCLLNDKYIYFDPYYSIDLNQLLLSRRNDDSLVCFNINDQYELNFERVLLTPKKGTWETKINRCCLIKLDHLYYLWYTGQLGERSCIGLATSKDGINFDRIQDNPVIEPYMDFEGKSVMNPSVIYDSNDKLFKMWYSAGECYEPDNICYATSKDGIHWNKYFKNPVFTKGTDKYDCNKVGGCQVFKNKSLYIMYYIGYQNVDCARICKAFSVDGLRWIRIKNNPLISPTKNGWDSNACYKPTILFDSKKNQTVMFYNGRKKDFESIGFAIKKGNDSDKL